MIHHSFLYVYQRITSCTPAQWATGFGLTHGFFGDALFFIGVLPKAMRSKQGNIQYFKGFNGKNIYKSSINRHMSVLYIYCYLLLLAGIYIIHVSPVLKMVLSNIFFCFVDPLEWASFWDTLIFTHQIIKSKVRGYNPFPYPTLAIWGVKHHSQRFVKCQASAFSITFYQKTFHVLRFGVVEHPKTRYPNIFRWQI